MNKPNNYDNTKAGGFDPVELGPHYAVIRNFKETQEYGFLQIYLEFDFAFNDRQAGYFADANRNNTSLTNGWPFNGTTRISVYDRDGNTTKPFKGFITAFEDSNGAEVKWSEGPEFAKQFIGRKIGVVYGEVEDKKNPGKFWANPRWFFDIHKFDTQKVPERKTLKKDDSFAPTSGSDDFMNVPDTETPFQ